MGNWCNSNGGRFFSGDGTFMIPPRVLFSVRTCSSTYVQYNSNISRYPVQQ